MKATLSDAQVRETVVRSTMSEVARTRLLEQALAGNPGARFSVFALRIKQEAQKERDNARG